MKITTILFDLDGTLLPMDQTDFTNLYFKLLTTKLAPHGYEPNQLLNSILSGIKAMVKNSGEKNNEKAFWDDFINIYGPESKNDIPIFEEFYQNEFTGAKAACGFNPLAAETVSQIKNMGFRVALATNPLFSAIATENRIYWAGLKPDDFELYTTYEQSHYCKPNPKYYLEVAEKLNVKPEECLMVGNDATEDIIAETIGMKVFLLTDCLINKENKDISNYPQGDFIQLLEFVKTL